ncbi:MAG: hypothetical protein KF764_14210 [Labilithrix sp.]|nr:hypothetical protein [Labilithrix sp.]MBX3221345.1 hypothetical protein [Labilithrix sp.]
MTSRAAWTATPLPAVIVPDAVGRALAAEVRRRVEGAGYTRFTRVDRGSYDVATSPNEAELLEALTGVAAEVTGRSLALVEARVLRLHPGDYLLVRHDRVHDDRPIELVLDLSPAIVAGAEVHYRHRGQVFFTVPSAPGSLAIVERGPTVMCNHTYVSRRLAGASVVRLMVLLRAEPRGDEV